MTPAGPARNWPLPLVVSRLRRHGGRHPL